MNSVCCLSTCKRNISGLKPDEDSKQLKRSWLQLPWAWYPLPWWSLAFRTLKTTFGWGSWKGVWKDRPRPLLHHRRSQRLSSLRKHCLLPWRWQHPLWPTIWILSCPPRNIPASRTKWAPQHSFSLAGSLQSSGLVTCRPSNSWQRNFRRRGVPTATWAVPQWRGGPQIVSQWVSAGRCGEVQSRRE